MSFIFEGLGWTWSHPIEICSPTQLDPPKATLRKATLEEIESISSKQISSKTVQERFQDLQACHVSQLRKIDTSKIAKIALVEKLYPISMFYCVALDVADTMDWQTVDLVQYEHRCQWEQRMREAAVRGDEPAAWCEKYTHLLTDVYLHVDDKQGGIAANAGDDERLLDPPTQRTTPVTDVPNQIAKRTTLTWFTLPSKEIRVVQVVKPTSASAAITEAQRETPTEAVCASQLTRDQVEQSSGCPRFHWPVFRNAVASVLPEAAVSHAQTSFPHSWRSVASEQQHLLIQPYQTQKNRVSPAHLKPTKVPRHPKQSASGQETRRNNRDDIEPDTGLWPGYMRRREGAWWYYRGHGVWMKATPDLKYEERGRKAGK